ncbi:hypothetical protein LBMAG12_02770 [Actinomycetes bacterium]|nr:hypothetical protein LBMAG12_02770 [Actinomycetes bacterium]
MRRQLVIGALLCLSACRTSATSITGEVPGTLQIAVATTTAESLSNEVSPDSVVGSSVIATEEELITAFNFAMHQRINCGRDPYHCDVQSFADVGSPLFVEISELMEIRRNANIVASKSGSLRYRIEAVEFRTTDIATVTTCITDDTVLVDGEIIFDDSLFSVQTKWTMVRSGQTWLWESAQALHWDVEEDICQFVA